MSTEIANSQKKKRTVFDQHGQSYELMGRIGEGGQGIVCTTNYPNVLVKVARATDERRVSWENKIRALMHQPLEGLPIAHPLAIITQPQLGYVMELMEGLSPMTDLIQVATEALMSGDVLSGYLKTGGLLRRLKILARLARVLAELHGRGLAYGDLSPANVFVSQSIEYAEVWLIDADNVSSLSQDGMQGVFTPDYGAPEILRGESGINTLTDSWSFAVMAYRILTLAHPLKGDVVLEGEPEREEAALRGEFPWVDHPTDRRNALSIGLPREITLNAPLRALFDQCFNAGLNNPGDRPSLNEWADVFEAATGHCDQCESCSSTFFYTQKLICPFCDSKQTPDRALVMAEYFFTPPETLFDQIGNKEQQNIPTVFSSENWLNLEEHERTLITRHCWSATGRRIVLTKEAVKLQGENSCCTIRLTESGEPEIIPDRTESIYLKRQSGKPVEIKQSFTFKKENRTGQRGELHLGSMIHGRTVWQFKW